MKESVKNILSDLICRYPKLSAEEKNIAAAFEILNSTYKNGGKILVCGNGGSAADSEHVVGELMKRFVKSRPIDPATAKALKAYGTEGEKLINTLEGAIPAMALTSHLALSTAYANDREPQAVFAQQLYGIATSKDTLIAISTSGNSTNCVLAAITAKAKGLKVISLTGAKDSKLSALSDTTIAVSETETYKIQELHLPVYHALCLMLEEENF